MLQRSFHVFCYSRHNVELFIKKIVFSCLRTFGLPTNLSKASSESLKLLYLIESGKSKQTSEFFSIEKNPDSYADRHGSLSQFAHILGAQHSPQNSGLSILSSILFMWYLSLTSDI